MRIAQIAPLYESVPPKLYGGTERVVHCLTEELVRRGHEVTLFASGDSVTSARLSAVTKQALRLDSQVVDPYVHVMRQVGAIVKQAGNYDIIHSHIDYFPWPFLPLVSTPMVTTLHGRLDLPDLPAIFREYPEAKLISISDSQRTPIPWGYWIATVHNGISIEDYSFQPKPQEYLAFLGRIAPEKKVDWAIEVAKRSGIRLLIAAKVDKVDRDYYQSQIKPLLSHPLVEYIGEIDQQAKNSFLGNARALLFPIDWPEPFGLVMAEAMATGTPVIARPFGSVPEIIEHGKTGFICRTVAEMVESVHNIRDIDRQECRKQVEERFTSQKMTDKYEEAYKKAILDNTIKKDGNSNAIATRLEENR